MFYAGVEELWHRDGLAQWAIRTFLFLNSSGPRIPLQSKRKHTSLWTQKSGDYSGLAALVPEQQGKLNARSCCGNKSCLKEGWKSSGIRKEISCAMPGWTSGLGAAWHSERCPCHEHKVIIVGLDNAGKTTILYQFSMNEVVHTSPTIGSNVEEIVVNNTRFLMWDIGGQESLRSSWNTYYTNTEFVIVVVDSTDRERISVTKEELYKMLAHEDLKKAGLLIFANKQDVKECMTVAEISQFLKLTSIKDHQWHIQACCALTGEGLCQGLEWMMSRLKIR
uniref:ARF like GTPase 5A n=1 Tax=Serinus canaria TaxID=9135 RepID=A0A8C9MPI2_SERCA